MSYAKKESPSTHLNSAFLWQTLLSAAQFLNDSVYEFEKF